MELLTSHFVWGGSQADEELKKVLIFQVDTIGLPDGSVLIAYNNNDTARTPLTVARSFDGGLSWRNIIVVENDPVGSFGYPTLLYEPATVCLATTPPCEDNVLENP